MSDFIARIAARAVGAPAVARPRLPAFHGGDAAIPDVADEPAAAPVAARVEESRSERVTPAARAAQEVEPLTIEKRSERVEVAARPTLERETVLSVERTIHERETAVAAPTQPLPQAPRELVRSEPAVAVQVTPVAVGVASQVTAAPVARAEEQTTVRVHIGRLEVRANVQQAPPQRVRRETPRPPHELTLGDYLRGKREAG